MALVTTFATTPLTALLYPPQYQRKLEAWKRGEIDWNSGEALGDGSSNGDAITMEKMESSKTRSLLVYLRLDNMPTLLAFVSLLGGKPNEVSQTVHPSHATSSEIETEPAGTRPESSRRPIEVHGVRLVELTERGSTVMKVSEQDEYSIFDPVINAFRVLGQLNNLAVSGEVAVVPENSYAETLVTKAVEESSDLLLLPWSETGSMSEAQTLSFDSVKDKLASDTYASFVATALNTAQCNAAVFINKGFSGSLKQRPSALQRTMSALSTRSHREHPTTTGDRSHHVYLPYFGGSDGKLALRMVLQLAENSHVTATLVHFQQAASSTSPDVQTITTKGTNPLQSAEDDAVFFASMQRSIPSELQSRVAFDTRFSAAPIDDALAYSQQEVGQNPRNGGDLIVVARQKGHATALGGCLGDLADRLLSSGVRASLLVVQAKGAGVE